MADDEVIITGRRGSGGPLNLGGSIGPFGAEEAQLLADYFAEQLRREQETPQVVVQAPKPKPPSPPPPSGSAAPTLPPPSIFVPEPIPEVTVVGTPPKPPPPPPPPKNDTLTACAGGTCVIMPLLPAVSPFGALPKPRPKPTRRAPARRTKPAPRPSRSPRPRSPTPRIRIPVPGLRFFVGRMLGVAALVPIYLETLRRISDNATDNMFERIYGGPSRDDRENEPIGPVAVTVPRIARPISPPEFLPVVTVTAPRPSPRPIPSPLPNPVFAPVAPPLFSGLPVPRFESVPRPAPRPQPTPRPVSPGVNPNVMPSPLQLPSPLTQPIPTPRPSPAPARPTAPPRTPTSPTSPLTPIKGSVLPFPGLPPTPKPELDKDPCRRPKKESKPRKDRTECKQGTYRQLKKGIVYTPRRKIPCR